MRKSHPFDAHLGRGKPVLMPRGDQVARFYALVMDLARSKHGLTAVTLAARRGLPLRTVYRDLHALEAAGFPITSSDGARWKLIEGWEARIPFPLPLGQLLALHLARDLMKPIRGTPVARDFDALCERLAGPLLGNDSKQGELFPRLRTVLATRSQLALDYSAHTAVIEALCRATEARRTVRSVYWSESRGEVTRRRINPCCLYYDQQLEALYVFGWCHTRRELRTFAVHRFRQVSLAEESFEPPAGFNAESYLRDAFRLWRGENTVQVRILVDRAAAGWVSERRWHASQKVEARADGACELTFTVSSVQELKRFALQLGAAAEVLAPEWFRREVADEHSQASQRYARRPRQRLSLDDTTRRDTRRGA